MTFNEEYRLIKLMGLAKTFKNYSQTNLFTIFDSAWTWTGSYTTCLYLRFFVKLQSNFKLELTLFYSCHKNKKNHPHQKK